MKIAVFGAGYVGLSLAVLLSQRYEVAVVDIVPEKVDLVNARKSPIVDKEIEAFLEADANGSRPLNLRATTDAGKAMEGASFAVIATPTDYDSDRDYFNTKSVEAALASIREANPEAWVVVKSTVPVGYTENLVEQTGDTRLLFSPEFLREGKALYDNLNPSRIIVGTTAETEEQREAATAFAGMLDDCRAADEPETPHIICRAREAECIKLFANTYLALRVAYFNELDTYAQVKGVDTSTIVKGVCLDPRIGDFYNNPSFGYGGYCLPKDTKQLLANYNDVPQDMITAVVLANGTRKEFIAEDILRFAKEVKTGEELPVVGIYHLTMKTGSDNFRNSSVQGVISCLSDKGVNVLIFEPLHAGPAFLGCEVTDDLQSFKDRSTVIVANRWNDELADVVSRVYTRDLFRRD